MVGKPAIQRAERLSERLATHAEGAFWDVKRQALLWVDMLAGRVLVTTAANTVSIGLPDSVASMVRPVSGSLDLLVVGEHTLWFLDPAGVTSPRRLADLPLPHGVRANEGCCSPNGRIFVGTMAYDGRAGGGDIWTFDDERAMRALAGTTISNGQHFRDPHHVVFTDSATQRIVSYTVTEKGIWADPHDLVEIPNGAGAPDGLCLDSEGGCWVALFDGAEIRRYDSAGQLTDRVTLPVPRPTSVSLGGPDLRTLFITTSALDLTGPPAAASGALYIATAEVQGAPGAAFRPKPI